MSDDPADRPSDPDRPTDADVAADETDTPADITADPDTPVHGLVRLGLAAFAVVFALLVASAVTLPISSFAVSLGIVEEGTNAFGVLQTVVQFGGFLLATVGYLAITSEWELLRLDRLSAREGGLVALAALGLLVLQYGALFALASVGLTTGENQAVVPPGDPTTYYLAMIVVSILVVGPVEEFLFRGVVQGGLRRAFDATPAILVASLIFGLVHFPAVAGTTAERLAYVGVVVGLGCVLGYLYERTDNVLIPGFAHGFYNAAIYVVLWAGV